MRIDARMFVAPPVVPAMTASDPSPPMIVGGPTGPIRRIRLDHQSRSEVGVTLVVPGQRQAFHVRLINLSETAVTLTGVVARKQSRPAVI